jgi:hypothetical protein
MGAVSRSNLLEKSVGEENGIVNLVSQRLFSLFVKIAFIFEPLVPRVISYYVRRRLSKLKKQGVISKFQASTKRLGKFHYKIEIDLGLTSKQASHFLGNLLPNQLNSLRRWFNV